MKSCDMTIQMKATEQYFHMPVLFIFKYLTKRNLVYMYLSNFDFKHSLGSERVNHHTYLPTYTVYTVFNILLIRCNTSSSEVLSSSKVSIDFLGDFSP